VTRVNLTQVDSAETKRTAYHGFGDVTRYRIESNEAWPKGGRNNLHKRHKRHLPFLETTRSLAILAESKGKQRQSSTTKREECIDMLA
jgi:hypothetical protein